MKAKREAPGIVVPHPTTGRPIRVRPDRDAAIDGDLGRELRRLPALISWYRHLRDEAKATLREAKYYEHNIGEDLYAATRAGKNGVKVTETELRMSIRSDPQMRAAFRQRMDAERIYDHLCSAVESIVDKRWMLQSLARWDLVERGVKDYE